MSSPSCDETRSRRPCCAGPYEQGGRLTSPHPSQSTILPTSTGLGGKDTLRFPRTCAWTLVQFPSSSEVDTSALVLSEDYDTMFAALSAEERSLDVIVTDYLTATEYMAKTPGVLKSTAAFTGESLGTAVDPSRSDILAAINSGLNPADDHYLLKDVITDWLAAPPEERPEGFVLHGDAKRGSSDKAQ